GADNAPRCGPRLGVCVPRPAGARESRLFRYSGPGPRLNQIGIVRIFGELPPQILVIAERENRVPYFLKFGIGGGQLIVELEGSLETGVEDEWGKRFKAHIPGHQAL